jgi:hypothetical protein
MGIPDPKKKKTATAAKAKKTGASTIGSATTMSSGAEKIHLDGEETDSVPIYDSCDEVRRKVNAHLRKSDVTQAQFLKDLCALLHEGHRKPTKGFQSSQLARFRGMSGAVSGNTSAIYYVAYVFFEKERLAAKKPKSQHREDMEEAWAEEQGVDTKRVLNNMVYVCHSSQQIYTNSLGKASVSQRY